MLLSLWPNWWDDWSEQWAVTFDGENRRIIVNPAFSTVNVKQDIYSNWKEWVQKRDNSKFLPALRTIGGDPLGTGQFAGDLYFLTNGWQVVIDHAVMVDGVLYHDDGIPPFVVKPGGGVTSNVSALVQTVQVDRVVEVAADPAPTPVEVADAVWQHSWTSKLLTVAKFLGLK
jgi:hypothetical protein